MDHVSGKMPFSNLEADETEIADETQSIKSNDTYDDASIDSWSKNSDSCEGSFSDFESNYSSSSSDSQSNYDDDGVWHSHSTVERIFPNNVFRNRVTIKNRIQNSNKHKPKGGRNMKFQRNIRHWSFQKLNRDSNSYNIIIIAQNNVSSLCCKGWQIVCSRKSTTFLLMSFLIWLYVQVRFVNIAPKRFLKSSHPSLFDKVQNYNITQLRESRRIDSLRALGQSASEFLNVGGRKARHGRSGGSNVEKLPPGCVSTSWQTYSFPNCNDIHDIDLQVALHMRRFGPKLTNMADSDAPIMADATEDEKRNARESGYVGMGLWRQVWKVDPRSEMTTKSIAGNDVPAVLKMMKSGHEVDQRNFDRHRRDALVMERLTSSKYVVSVYGFCGNSVLTAYAGRTLKDFIHEPTEEEIQLEKYDRKTSIGKLQLALDVVRGVKALHEINDGPIIHADIQSQQFLFDPIKGVQINDFNRCRFIPHNEKNGSACKIKIPQAPGRSRAPEEYERFDLTEKLDIFSLGHILYVILVGEEPWADDNKKQFVHKIMKGYKPSFPKEFTKPDTAYNDLSNLILKCYEYEAEKRISAVDLAKSIERILRKEKEAVRRTS